MCTASVCELCDVIGIEEKLEQYDDKIKKILKMSIGKKKVVIKSGLNFVAFTRWLNSGVLLENDASPKTAKKSDNFFYCNRHLYLFFNFVATKRRFLTFTANLSKFPCFRSRKRKKMNQMTKISKNGKMSIVIKKCA